MTLDLLARLVVLLACAVALGTLYVRLARPRSGPAPHPGAAEPRTLPGAIDAALGAFVVVAGGAALTGIGLAGAEGAGMALVRLAGIVVLAAAGGLAVVARGGRGPLGPPALVGMAWLGAGLALAAPLVLLVAAIVIVVLAVRVAEPPAA